MFSVIVEDIKTKINSLRTQFNKEMAQIRTHPSGSCSYNITLWCFEKLLFLQDHVQSRKSSTNLPENLSHEDETTDHQEGVSICNMDLFLTKFSCK